MKKIALVLWLLVLVLSLNAEDISEKCVYGKNCTVYGTISKEIIYGAPGYGEDPLHDKKLTAYIVKFLNPIKISIPKGKGDDSHYYEVSEYINEAQLNAQTSKDYDATIAFLNKAEATKSTVKLYAEPDTPIVGGWARKVAFHIDSYSTMNTSQKEVCSENIDFKEFRHTNPYFLSGKCTKQGFYIVSVIDKQTAFGYLSVINFDRYLQPHKDTEEAKPVIIKAKDSLSKYFSDGTSIKGKFKIIGTEKITLSNGEERTAITLEWLEKE